MTTSHILQEEGEEIMAEWISEAESYDMDEKAQINVRKYDIAEWWIKKVNEENLRVAKNVLQRVREDIGEISEYESFGKLSFEKHDGINEEKARLRLACDTIEREVEG